MMDNIDIAIIGAGIHGAGIAQAAATAGYSVRVLEQYDQPAKGTSSRSSKLIHGGLRYLETAQFTLVKECLREREILLRIAPELVHLKAFYIPIYRTSTRGPLILRLGLSIYALLGGLRRTTRFRELDRREWGRLDGLTTHGLETIFQFYDAQTDDAALTAAVMHSAVNLGSELYLGAKVEKVELHKRCCAIHYRHNECEKTCLAKVTINAAGPWANRVIRSVSPSQSPVPVELIQGTHIVLPGKLRAGIYYVEAPQDGRAIFIMPWKDATMVGTTEHFYEGPPDCVAPKQEEVDYLLETLRYYFPTHICSNEEILHAFAGARVLPLDHKKATKRPREIMLVTDRNPQPRLLSVLGGKLTAYRATAEKVLKIVSTSLPHQPRSEIDTRFLPLTVDN